MFKTTLPESEAPPVAKTLFRGALCGRKRRESSPSRSVFAEVSPESERVRGPIPVRGNKLRDDKPFSMDDEATEGEAAWWWFLNL